MLSVSLEMSPLSKSVATIELGLRAPHSQPRATRFDGGTVQDYGKPGARRAFLVAWPPPLRDPAYAIQPISLAFALAAVQAKPRNFAKVIPRLPFGTLGAEKVLAMSLLSSVLL